ncbi:MAG: efflux RND transporter permease subunit [Bacteroidaceae bacterium]|nr:efflux RND transporter permease subunit [Bacteroidaceae bacterium]
MKGTQKGKNHAFSIILIMIVLMLVGAACIPFLNVQYNPIQENLNLNVSFGGNGSARVVETEVTSVVEGVLNTVDGVSNITANTYQGGGNISLTFKKGTNMETIRFDVATRLRQIRSKLPEESRPQLSGSTGGGGRGSQQILRYTINADMPAIEIVRYADEHLRVPLSRIEGVESVSTSGATPFEWVLTFDPNSLRAVGMGPGNLSEALNRYFQNSIVGTEILEDELMLVRLKTRDLTGNLEQIPIGMINGRMYYMGDFATVQYREQPPSSYNRINGLNTISLWVNALDGINTITVTDAVKKRMEELKADLPDNFAIKLNYDASEYLNNEMQKIFFRAVISLAILLLFVLGVSRSFRYLTVIGLTIIVNLLSAVLFYKVFGVDIEIYSMAGITVSLGIIIDTAIVIADHYTYYGDRKVMFSITGALLTTIGALLLVFFLPEEARGNLTDFIWVIVINLSLSIIIAFLFVPALLEYLPLKNKGVVNNTMKRRRRLVKYTDRYERLTSWSRAHRWIYIVALILLFGIPIQLLPSQVHHRNSEEGEDLTKGGLVGLYNKTIGSKWYQRNKRWFEYPLGGTLNYFQKHSRGRMSFSRQEDENREVVLYVYAELAEGQTVQQLNEIVMEMENWLQQYNEISDFYTSLSGTSGSLEIHFKDEYQRTRFPFDLKQRLWAKAMGYGGATWSIPSLGEDDQSLNNSVYRTSWSNSIDLFGYNYDLLYRYAEELIDSLKVNRRVNGQAGFTNGRWNSFVANEFYMDLDRERLIRTGTNLNSYLSFISDQLYDSHAGKGVFDGHNTTPVRLVSSDKDYYDLWHIRNDMVVIDSMNIRLSDLGSITKRRTGLNIQRNNQEYKISVGYEFIGSFELRSKMENDLVKSFNKHLPMGFRVGNDESYGWWSEQKQRTVLIFVVVLVIFMICASMFESFKVPLMIVLLIPVSFMGLFLAYPIFGVTFDQGGYAAMIMLCGITVNAGIYLTSEYRTIAAATGRHGLKTYIKAYNRKIVPTMLTILSTVLGLVPFLFEGKQNQFWFSFAIGVMSGMLFSVIAIVLVMPVFFPLKAKSHEII